MNAFSRHRPKELKILVIDNAGFHSTQNLELPSNIKLINIPAYSPELNPCEQIWKFIKQRFKNKVFDNIIDLKIWLHNIVRNMSADTIKSICSNHFYTKTFNGAFNN